MNNYRHKRTLSSTNGASTKTICDYIALQQESVQNKFPLLQRDVTKSTMVIPLQFSNDLLIFYIDEDVLKKLEQKKAINWCRYAQVLLPIWCEDDGNSLLHAISLYVFGVHDRNGTLRSLIYQMMFMEYDQIRNKRSKSLIIDLELASIS